MKYSTEELLRKIEEETQLIKAMESSWPPYYREESHYHAKNEAWRLHEVKIKDAHWRRRNWQAYLENPNYDPMTNPG